MLFKKTILLLFATALLQNIFSQTAFFKTFTLQDDNYSFKINCLYKNYQGFIYAGTTNGLYLFDGIAFKKIKINNAVSKDTVTAVFQDNTGLLWAGLKNGHIATGSNAGLTYINPEEGLPKVAITTFLQDGQNNIWFGTNGEGIYYFYNRHLYLIDDAEGLSDKYIHAMAQTSNGAVLAATDQGINICKVNGTKKTVQVIGPKNGLPDYYITSVTAAGNNNFWIGMQEKGFCLYNYNTGQITIPPAAANWQNGQVNTVLQAANNIWIATQEKGLYQLNNFFAPLKMANINTAQNNINNLVQDDEGNLWMNSPAFLLSTAADKIQLLPLYNSSIYETIHTILSDYENNIWAGTDGGLIKYDLKNNSSKKITITGLTASTDITSLYQDAYHNIWISTMGAGVFVLNPATGRYRHLTENPLLKNASILSVTGNGNTVCMGGLEGVATIFELTAVNKNIDAAYSFTNYNNIPNIGNNYIHNVYKDNAGCIWFATDGKGITVLQNGHFTSFNTTNGLADNIVYSFTEDKKGNIWFNTKDAGIYCYDGKKFKNLNLTDGISNLKISALKTDSKGNIIIINEKGIDILNPATGTVSYLDNTQGIAAVNSGIAASTKDSAGNILLSTATGVLVYAPAASTVLKPATILDEVLLFLNPVSANNSVFSYDENSFTFNFTGLYYTNPERVRYQYRLDGLDTTWITTKDRSIPFPNLRPGKYTFHVRSSVTDNFKNAGEAVWSFTIKQPLWKRPWFIILSILTGAALIAWYIKYREKEIKKIQLLQQEKIQFQFQVLGSQVNPHFLFNSFNTLISAIEDDPKAAVSYVEHLSAFFRNIVNYRDKDIITLGEELNLLNTYYFLQQKRYGTSLQLNITVTETEKKQWLVPPLTLQLLMENAVKHNAVSKETVLTIDVYTENNNLILRNNINPKITQQPGTGMGLQNIANRYKLLSKHEVQITNNNDYFTVILPAIKND